MLSESAGMLAPLRTPDRVFTVAEDRCDGRYWEPAAINSPGKVEATVLPGQNVSPLIIRDVLPVARQVHAAPVIRPLLTALGITTRLERTDHQTTIEVSVPCPTYFAAGHARLLGAAGLTNGITFAAYPGGEYQAREFAASLADRSTILLAAQKGSPEIPHDMYAHGIAWALVPGYFINLARTEARKALSNSGDDLADFMHYMDTNISRVGFGRSALEAAQYEADHAHNTNSAVQHKLSNLWLAAGTDMSWALRRRTAIGHETATLAQEARGRMAALQAAAHRLTTD